MLTVPVDYETDDAEVLGELCKMLKGPAASIDDPRSISEGLRNAKWFLRRADRCKALWAKPTQVLKPRVPEEGIYLRQLVDKRVASRGIDSLLRSWIQAFASEP